MIWNTSAYYPIPYGKAVGHRTSLWFRSLLQQQLFQLGCFLHQHAGKVLFVAVLVLSSFCVGLKSAVIHSSVEQLWVQDGGRLDADLRYTEAALGEAEASTHQLVIQTSKEPGASLLHPGALLSHLDVVREATAVTVDLFDLTWRLKDICQTPSIPNFDIHFIDTIFDSMIPCAIITPLDCFWEGSKLLGPDYPIAIPGLRNKGIKWTNLHPVQMMESMKTIHGLSSFAFSTLELHMKRAGITAGYQEKPCLDPKDVECPDTAPNKASGIPPDIGRELTGGCYGFAAKFMHWPEDAIVGGAKRNKTGNIQRASAYQTVVQLMGERELFEYWSETYKVHHVEWTQEKAALVLDTWQKRFSEEVKRQMSGKGATSPRSSFLKNYDIFAFSSDTLNDVLSRFSEPDFIKIGIACLLMLVYTPLTLYSWKDHIKSQCTLGIAAVILVIFTIAAGLGLCAVLGLPFCVLTTQIMPLFALGFGVDNMFLISHIYAEQNTSDAFFNEQVGLLLKKAGLGVLLSSGGKILTLVAAALIPLPALRVFSYQLIILSVFLLGATLFVFPAIISLDMKRRRANRMDVLCCCLPLPPNSPKDRRLSRKVQAVTRALPPDRMQTVTSVLEQAAPMSLRDSWKGSADGLLEAPKSFLKSILSDPVGLRGLGSWYAHYIVRPPVKFVVIVFLLATMGVSAWGVTKLKVGLKLTDIVPGDTAEHDYLAAQEKFLGFYNMYAVTKGEFEYPTNQRLLYEYHDSFMRVPSIIKNDNGGLPDFWLAYFRDWLIGLQKAFEKDWSNGCITQEWWFKNATDDGILAYKLLVQTGRVDNPIDKSLVTQVKLVDNDGIINPKAFYNYLSAWATNDALAYGASQANLRPEPKEWFHVPTDVELKIPKSTPLVYAQMPFLLRALNDTIKITKLINQVRALCIKFESKGLPNFPSGIPFLFWEPYVTLEESLQTLLLIALAMVFVLVFFVLMNPWIALIVTLSVACIILQLLGFMGLAGYKLSTVAALVLIIFVGMAVHFTIHLCLGFLTFIGDKDRRVMLSIEHMFTPVLQAGVAIVLSIALLQLSDFEFVIRYFFCLTLAFVTIALANGMVFLPVVLSLVGPPGEVTPLGENPDRIATPSPEPVRKVHAPKVRVVPPPPSKRHPQPQPYREREPSLTTITEEGSSWHSTSQDPPEQTQTIVLEPEFVVETTTCTHPHVSSSLSDSSSSSFRESAQSQVTTKVTATAKVKVEVHTPLTGSVEKTRHSRRHSSRDSNSDCSASSRHS